MIQTNPESTLEYNIVIAYILAQIIREIKEWFYIEKAKVGNQFITTYGLVKDIHKFGNKNLVIKEIK